MGQRVVITAAASGIGLAIAQRFAREGAFVEVCDIDAAAVDAASHLHPSITASHVNVGDGDALDWWLGAALERLGGVDVLVNNAGIKGPTAMVEDIDPDDWAECISVCLDSHFRTARSIVPLMKTQGFGSIINMSSTAGLVGYGMRSPYSAAKWAVIGLTKSLAIELGPHGVRCNAICPGSVAGDRIDRVIASEAAHRGVPAATVTAEYVNGQSIKRFVEPGEIAEMCVFLSSPAATMITGQAIAIDGHTEAYHLG